MIPGGRCRLRRRLPITVLLPFLLAPLVLSACDNDVTPPPDTLRFGQIGEIRVSIVAPRVFGEGRGELQQILTWGSTGAWVLREVLSYRDLEGDESIRRNEGDPATYASAYATLITQLNEADGIKLFPLEELPPDLSEPCITGWTRISFTIRDDVRDREITWTRCTQGTLGTLQTGEAGPDLAAGRVIQAAILVRDFTQGSRFASTYIGSVPFGTLDRGEDSGAHLEEPRVFASIPWGNPRPPTGWEMFWAAHNGARHDEIPQVDWATEMVIVAEMGLRTEAGDSIEVRQILQTGNGTQVNLVERVPGDFCSPAARDHYPFHIVVAPRTLDSIRFGRVDTVRVSCGI